ncbi:MAG: cytochrome c biogenesis protein CcsA [Ignavibacteriales bacterium]|nr:cytochrome c biogenesis protein CcsA [Ignavibacteriales bacterium]
MAGTICLFLACAGGIAAVAGYGLTAFNKRQWIEVGRLGLAVSGLAIVAAAVLLMRDILTHNFANAYVWGYSDRSLPLHFLLSTFYAGQEGSFLFWAVCSVILSVALLRYTKSRNLEAHVLTLFMLSQTFLVVLLLTRSPFQSIWDAFPGQLDAGVVPPDGKGLNPLLQNFWMVIHPPVLFVGFAAMAVQFCFAVAALWRREYSRWMISAMPWILFTGMILGLGIMLGAYWAYGVLGWGGYWGWDPVENSSLIPWIISMALLHTLLVQKRNGNLIRTNFVLAIVSYLLVLYSTFLTRSGVLGESSVHSFTDPGTMVYGLLLAYVGVFAVIGFGLLLVRTKDISPVSFKMQFFSRGTWLLLGSSALLLSAVAIFFGTSLPLISKTTVEPSFYDAMNLPIVIVIGLLIGFSLQLRWEEENGWGGLKRSAKWTLIAALGTVIAFFLGVKDVLMILFAFASLFAFLINLEAAYLVGSGKYATKEHRTLGYNMPEQVLGYTLTYKGARPIDDGKKLSYAIDVEKDGSKFTLTPVMFEAGQQGMMRNPDIKSSFTRDFYVSPISLEQSGAESYSMKKGESISVSGAEVRFVKFDLGSHGMGGAAADGKMIVGAQLEVSAKDQKEIVTPTMAFESGNKIPGDVAPSNLLHAGVAVSAMNIGMGPEGSSIVIDVVRSSAGGAVESLVIEASIKPGMNLLWSGSVLLFLGLIVSMFHRKKESL